jgi:hypothetical protein
VLEERLEIIPPAPQEGDLFVDIGVRERASLGST